LTLIEDLIRFGFDASEIDAPAFSLWPEPCRVGYNILNLEPDPFFVEWISKNLEVCPGKLEILFKSEQQSNVVKDLLD
jgi:hypothetical protein